MAARRAGAWNALALSAADTASENVLGLLATTGPDPLSDRESWDQIYQHAIKALRAQHRNLPPGLGQRVVRAHRARNIAVHIGSEPSATEVARAIATCRDLMAFAAAGSPLLTLLAGAGPLHAVAELVTIPAVVDPLREAGDALVAERYTEAADKAAVALEQALLRISPPIRPYFSRHPPRFGYRVGEPRVLGDLEDYLQWADQRLGMLDEWVLSVAVGLPANELRAIRDVLGRPIFFAGGNIEVRRSEKVVLTPATVHRCALEAASMIYRLSQSNAIALLDWEVRAAGRKAAVAGPLSPTDGTAQSD